MIRAAIVGIGHWGRTLVNAVQGNSDKLRFTAGHTRTAARAEAFCAEKGIALYDSLDAILADPAIDAVYFATPHSEHGGHVERAAAAGKHVFMEKPFTLDRKVPPPRSTRWRGPASCSAWPTRGASTPAWSS